MHSMDLNPITPCTGLESCSPLVLLLVGKFAQTKQILVCLCAGKEHISTGELQAAHGKRWSWEHLQRRSRWVPQECLCSVGWFVTYFTGCFHGHFPHPHKMLMLLNSWWLWGRHREIKVGDFLWVTEYRTYSWYPEIRAILNGPGRADPGPSGALALGQLPV